MISAATHCLACGAAMPAKAIYCSHCATAREDPNTRALFVVDGTTGLFNDAFTGALVDHETSRAIRYRRPLTVLVAMVDHSDFITQDLGDGSRELFRELADVIAGSVRDIDTVGYLGDRFCIVLPETDQGGAVVAAEKLMHTVASHQYREGGQWGRITISIGAASVGFDRMEKQDLVGFATQALLEGRADGSNRVHLAHHAN